MLGLFLDTFWGPEGLPRASPKESLVLTVFWPILDASWDPSWEPCCDKMGLLNFLKLLFSSFLPFRKACIFRRLFEKPWGSSWDRLGTVLGPFWEGFGSQNRCQHRPWRKCQKCIFASTRIKKARLKRIEKASKIKNRCQNDLPHMLPKSPKNYTKSFPKWSQEGPKRPPKWCQNPTST